MREGLFELLQLGFVKLVALLMLSCVIIAGISIGFGRFLFPSQYLGLGLIYACAKIAFMRREIGRDKRQPWSKADIPRERRIIVAGVGLFVLISQIAVFSVFVIMPGYGRQAFELSIVSLVIAAGVGAWAWFESREAWGH